MKKLVLLVTLLAITACHYNPPKPNPYYDERDGAYNKRFYRNDYKK